MDREDKEMIKQLAEGDKAMVFGDQVYYPPLMVGEKAFHFTPIQNRWMFFIQKYGGDKEKACYAVGVSMEWANAFLASRKFKDFRNRKLALAAARSGELADWWWETGLDGAKGYKEWYAAKCDTCHEENIYTLTEIEMARGDDMKIRASCKVCMQDVQVEHHKEDYKPSREQVQFWSELGNRLAPKIERVQHQFSEENFVFVPGGSSD